MHISNHYKHREELVLLDRKNPRSLVSLVPEAMAIQIEKLWKSELASEVLGLNEIGLLKNLKRLGRTPDPLDHKVRVKFWLEFERIQDQVRLEKLNMANILGNDFPKDTFYRFYITDPYKLAFLLRPTGDFSILMEMVQREAMNTLLRLIGEMDTSDKEMHLKQINKLLHVLKVVGGRGMGRPSSGGEEEGDSEVAEVPEETEAQRKERLEALKKAEESTLPGQI